MRDDAWPDFDRTERRRHRPTVALLLDYLNFLDGAYQSRLTEAFDEVATRRGVDLRVLFGRAFAEPSSSSRAHNGIFELVDARSVDAVVVVTTVLSVHCGIEGMRRNLQRYAPLPLVSVGVPLPGVPSVVIDNQASFAALVEHVIARHGRRHIAFLAGAAGNPESEARFAGYRAALERHGLPFDPALVGRGDYLHSGARQATAQILDATGVIDALVAANDTMAFGAIDALKERGLLVPADVIVTGFDDVHHGRVGNVALTTVAQPFELMAERALDAVLQQLRGETCEPVVELSAALKLRRSCGCGQHVRKQSTPSAEPNAAEFARQREPALLALVHAELSRVTLGPPLAAQALLQGLRAELEGLSGAFQAVLEEVLGRAQSDELLQALHEVIESLRAEFWAVSTPALEDVWFRALSRLAHGCLRTSVEHRIQLDNEYLKMLATADRMSIALDLPALGEAMAGTLLALGVRTAQVVCFPEGERERALPLVRLVDGASVSGDSPPLALLPKPVPGTRNVLVFPLVFESRWLGVACFEYRRGVYGYQIVRDQLAAALGHVTLHQQVLSKTMLHERSQQERQATARRLEALSVLAGGVAHDLNNTLGPLIALPDVILQDLGRLEPGRSPRTELLDQLAADVRCIKSASMRAAQTITDLLTLGRQGRARRDPLDLNRAIDFGLWQPLHELARERPEIRVRLELASEPLHILASEAHVLRALNNLVRNAAEAMPSSGEIVVRTRHVRLSQPTHLYELVPPGDYVVVSVTDSGSGIPVHELDRVFEPFFSRKQLGEHSGSGLGLAIVHGVAKEHDGYVDLQTELGRGTTFSLYFPRSHETQRPKSLPAPTPRVGARLLLVEDDPLQRRTARRVLVSLGYEVEALHSATRTLEVLEQARRSGRGGFDLLLIDVMLNQELDGVQLLRQVRRLFPEQKALLTSGRRRDDAIGDDMSAVIWLEKPYTTERLVKAVEAALSQPELAIA